MKFSYRFLRLDWAPALNMAETLNGNLLPGERVVSMSADRDEVLVLMERPIPASDLPRFA